MSRNIEHGADSVSGAAALGTRPVALIILDGWGLAPPGPGNAVDQAHTPNFDRIWECFPRATLTASGLDVGLPVGQMGNSEVGHLNLGAGRVVYQDLTRIDRAMDDGTLAASPALREAIARCTDGGSTLHVVGLCSHGGVHSSLAHIGRIVHEAAAAGCPRVMVHAITDGRDVAPTASLTDLRELEEVVSGIAARTGVDVRVATVTGRYWTMDRDHRWDRTKRGWDAMVHAVAPESASSAYAAAQASHAAGITDEFIAPTIIGTPSPMHNGDVVVLANFRPDRMRQLAAAYAVPDFAGFDRGAMPAVHVVCMTEYDASLHLPVIFPPHHVEEPLAAVLEAAGVGQLHVAETEKYAHVTYFFNGGEEREHTGEARVLAPSPRDVATYDERPMMNAEGVADGFIAGFADASIGFAVLNFANPDMVGHTGSIPAAVAACEAVDVQLGRVLDAVEARGGTAIVTADHGNAECMLAADGSPHTAHTTNPVPCILVGDAARAGVQLRDGGRLADVAPTVLDLLGIAQPAEMNGASLLVRVSASV
jgi:2,3-bisphosphoglycerate-independent phosphoglycerate mutase